MQVEKYPEKVYDSLKSSFTILAAYVNSVAREIGMKRALRILSKTFENMALFDGMELRNQSDVEYFDAKTAMPILNSLPERLGLKVEVVESNPIEAIMRIKDCPFYQAAKIVGLDPQLFCENGLHKYFETVVQQLNPELHFEIDHFKDIHDKEDICEEAIVLKE